MGWDGMGWPDGGRVEQSHLSGSSQPTGMAGCRRAREEQPCGPCRGALAFGFSHPGAASAPACPQTDSLDASHRMAPPPRRHLLTSWSLRFGWLRAAAWSPNATARLFAWLPPRPFRLWTQTNGCWNGCQEQRDGNKRKGSKCPRARQTPTMPMPMPPRVVRRGRGDKRKREVTDGGRAPAVPFACLDASSPTPTRRATTPLRCANCQKLLSGFGWEEPGRWLAGCGWRGVRPSLSVCYCYYHR